MKKLKLAMSSLSGEALTRDQLKVLMGGDDLDGDCQGSGSACDTQRALNCCNGFLCAEYICYPKPPEW